MSLKRSERESLRKSFLLFFLSLNLLGGIVAYFVYVDSRSDMERRVFNQMRLCSLDLQCDRFDIDFVETEGRPLNILEHSDGGLEAYFSIPRSERYVMKLRLSEPAYRDALDALLHSLLWRYLVVALGIALLSLAFSFYALNPLRNALKLTEEFVKDILHDFNTPLAALRLNLGMLRRELGAHPKVGRMEEGIERIIALQSNLRSYLNDYALEEETIDLDALLHSRVAWFGKLYAPLPFNFQSDGTVAIRGNREVLTRILDNLLDNAGKYNVKGGSVTVILNASPAAVTVADTGRGIQYPDRVFERFYKEHERGMGIGLHIVKKLCDALGVTVSVESELGAGSRFRLDLETLMLR
jgi:two-component system, OmpR family, sensor kinase